jgi:hypothetical protein
LPRHLFDTSEILGAIPVPGSVLHCRPVHSGKRAQGRVSPQTPVAVRSYVRSSSDLVQHRICLVSSLLDRSPAPLASGEKDGRVAPDNLTGASVSPSLEKQGPKSSTVSARISLSEVTPSTPVRGLLSGAWTRLVTKQRNCYSPFIRTSGLSSEIPPGSV